jgi:hypothetical protein
VGNSLSVKGSTYLGTNPSLSTDTLTVGMTSTFLETATFSKGIAANLGIGDTSADYPLEVLSTATQFTISHTDGTAYTEFSVDSNGDLNINPSGGNITINDAYTLPSSDGSSSQFLQTDGSGAVSWATVADTNPGGSDGQMQYNNGGSFGGTSQFYYDDVNNHIGIGDATPDYIVEIIDTATQLTLTNVDGSSYSEFFVNSSGDLEINPSGGNVSIASANLTTTGKITAAQFQMTTSPTAGYVLSSDASGNATWADISGSGGAWTI